VIRGALAFAPKDAWINFLYGRLILREDRADAIRHWETVLQVNPDYDECAVSLAHQRLIDKNYPEVIRLLEKALVNQGNNGFGWLDLSDAYSKSGRIPDALHALDKAVAARLSPKPELIASRRSLITATSPSH
jgi:tetratricopeptide (TPR) repeat protein